MHLSAMAAQQAVEEEKESDPRLEYNNKQVEASLMSTEVLAQQVQDHMVELEVWDEYQVPTSAGNLPFHHVDPVAGPTVGVPATAGPAGHVTDVLSRPASVGKFSSADRVIRLWPDHYKNLCNYSALIKDDISGFQGASRKTMKAKLKQEPLRKEIIETNAHSLRSAASSLKLSLAEISMVEAIDTCAAGAKDALVDAIEQVQDLQTPSQLDPARDVGGCACQGPDGVRGRGSPEPLRICGC